MKLSYTQPLSGVAIKIQNPSKSFREQRNCARSFSSIYVLILKFRLYSNSRPHVPSATPSRMSEEDQLSSSTDRKSASDPLSTPLPSGEERSNLRNFTHSRVSIGETSRFRNSDTASVSSSSSTARATSLLKYDFT